jgi:hypothetical protein
MNAICFTMLIFDQKIKRDSQVIFDVAHRNFMANIFAAIRLSGKTH